LRSLVSSVSTGRFSAASIKPLLVAVTTSVVWLPVYSYHCSTSLRAQTPLDLLRGGVLPQVRLARQAVPRRGQGYTRLHPASRQVDGRDRQAMHKELQDRGLEYLGQAERG